MGQDSKSNSHSPDLVTSPKQFFEEQVNEAFHSRKLDTLPIVKTYLVNMLQYYILTDHLFDETAEDGRKKQETLAEQLLRAAQAESSERVDRLKRLGDTSLYVSGFFGDSLKRKIVDIDYYAEIGGTAYATLAVQSENELYGQVYKEFSRRFLEFVDVLTYISQKSMVQTNTDLLRLYDRYVTTGSELARDQLIEKGLLTLPRIERGSKQ
jgi:hypothetical protein